LAQVHPDDPVRTHHPVDPLVVHLDPGVAQLSRDARGTVGAVELVVNPTDPRRELLVGTGTFGPGRRGGEPPVETGSGHLEDLAQPLHRRGVAVVVDELEAAHQLVSPAKYFADLRRISRSVSSLRICALSCLFSSSSTDSDDTPPAGAGFRGRSAADAVPVRLRSARTQLRRVSRLTPR